MHTPAPLHLNKRGHFHDKGQLLTFIGSACFDISEGCVCVSVCVRAGGGRDGLGGSGGSLSGGEEEETGGPDERSRVGKCTH